jgi:16S rRNA (guanine527-N7)-methyltransferase
VSQVEERLTEVLLESQRLGFLGPGPVEQHIHHARGFVNAVEEALGRAPGSYLDLGTGGGVPGLVLALVWPEARGAFLDAGVRRCAALRAWVARLALDGRVEVLEGRAEELARVPELREQAEAVTARGFAVPAATAEIASGFVAVGGVVVVSDPPEHEPGRWPPAPLAGLGLAARSLEFASGHFTVLRKHSPAPDAVPRPAGRPAKRPLW